MYLEDFFINYVKDPNFRKLSAKKRNLKVYVACVASVSVKFRKEGGRGSGRWSKEMLAVKPLDFENRPLGLSCLSDFMLSSAVIN